MSNYRDTDNVISLDYYSIDNDKEWYEDNNESIVLKPYHLLDDAEIYWLFESWTHYFPCPLALRIIYEKMYPARDVLVTEDDTAINLFEFEDSKEFNMLGCDIHTIFKNMDIDGKFRYLTGQGLNAIVERYKFSNRYYFEHAPIVSRDLTDEDAVMIFPMEELDFFEW